MKLKTTKSVEETGGKKVPELILMCSLWREGTQ